MMEYICSKFGLREYKNLREKDFRVRMSEEKNKQVIFRNNLAARAGK